MDGIEQLEEVEKSTYEEEEVQNQEETGYERFPLAETSANIHQSDGRLASAGVARGCRGWGEREKGRESMRVNHKRSLDRFSRWGLIFWSSVHYRITTDMHSIRLSTLRPAAI